VRPKDYERWQAGEYVQACFPYLSPEQRELLIPDLGQGLCGACFDKLGDAEETGR
jgi:hypothetical protein